MSLTDTLYNRTTTIQMHDGRRIMVLPDGELVEIGDEKRSDFRAETTFINTGCESENASESNTETYSECELKLLRQIENA